MNATPSTVPDTLTVAEGAAESGVTWGRSVGVRVVLVACVAALASPLGDADASGACAFPEEAGTAPDDVQQASTSRRNTGLGRMAFDSTLAALARSFSSRWRGDQGLRERNLVTPMRQLCDTLWIYLDEITNSVLAHAA